MRSVVPATVNASTMSVSSLTKQGPLAVSAPGSYVASQRPLPAHEPFTSVSTGAKQVPVIMLFAVVLTAAPPVAGSVQTGGDAVVHDAFMTTSIGVVAVA